MKRIISMLSIILLLTIITGCGCSNKKYDINTCEFENDQSASGYIAKNTYEIYSKDDIVEKVEVSEEIEVDSNTILKHFEKELKERYEKANKSYGGYKYDIKLEDKKVILNATIDYTKMDVEKYIEENQAMKNYANDKNEITKKGLMKMYETNGSICK